MITTNLTLTNGATSEVPVQVTGITFEVDSKLAVNPSVIFPFDVAIDSSEIIGIDFDETLHTGDYTESITINTLGGRNDIVHAVTIDDLTPPIECDDGLVVDGCFDGEVLADDWAFDSASGIIEGNRLKITSEIETFGAARYTIVAEVGAEYEFSFDAEAGTHEGYQYSVYDWTNSSTTVPSTPYVPAEGRVSVIFTATGESTAVYVIRDGITVPGDCFVDNVSVKIRAAAPIEETPLPAVLLDVTSATDMSPNSPLVGDGVVDETLALEAIVADTNITNLYFPAGKTFRTETVIIGGHIKALSGGGVINSIEYEQGDGFPYGALKVTGVHTDFVVDGLTFFNEGRIGSEFNGQLTFEATMTNTQIRRCTFDSLDAYADCVKVYGEVGREVDGLYIYDNDFINVQAFAIEIFESTNPRDPNGLDDGLNNIYVVNNSFVGHTSSDYKEGISVAGARFNNNIYGNTLNGLELGIELHGTNHSYCYDNTMINTQGTPFMISGGHDEVVNGEDVKIYNNTSHQLEGSDTKFVQIYNGSLAEIYDNYFDCEMRIERRMTGVKAGVFGDIHHNTIVTRDGNSGILLADDGTGEDITSLKLRENDVYLGGTVNTGLSSNSTTLGVEFTDNNFYAEGETIFVHYNSDESPITASGNTGETGVPLPVNNTRLHHD